MALAGCASHSDGSSGGDGAGIGGGAGPNDPSGQTMGALQTALKNTGTAVDNVAPLQLDTTLGNVGKSLDSTLDPALKTVTGLTQKVGATTGLGQIGRASCRERVCQYV